MKLRAYQNKIVKDWNQIVRQVGREIVYSQRQISWRELQPRFVPELRKRHDRK